MEGIDSSKILLLIIENPNDKDQFSNISAKQLVHVFRHNSVAQRVLITKRNSSLEAYFEYSSKEQAISVYNYFNGRSIKDLGQVKLFFSSLKEAQKRKNTFDYYEKEGNPFLKKELIKENVIVGNKVSKQKLDKGFGKQNQRISCLKENKQESKSENNKLALKSLELKDLVKYSRICNTNCSRNEIKNEQTESNIETTISSSNDPFYHNAANKQQLISIKKDCTKDKVISFSNLSYIFKNCNEIHNIFSCFGNIKTIVYFKNNQRALIEYRSEVSTKNAILNMNGRKLGPSKFKVRHSKKQHLNLLYNQNNTENPFLEILQVSKEMNRFKEEGYQKISSSLILKVAWINNIKPIDVYRLIEQYCKPLSIEIRESIKNDQRFMIFKLNLGSELAAIYLMYKCHGLMFKNSKLSISFR